MRFHVLGIGSIGTLVSHHLRLANPDAPISLVVRSARAFPSTRVQQKAAGQRPAISLSVLRNGDSQTSGPFDQEVCSSSKPLARKSNDPDATYGPIRSLIVCLKTPNTLEALAKLKHRIAPNSVVALLQNGMGVYDELCAKIWPEPATRPFFLLGTTTHGVTPSYARGQVTHMSRDGEGDIKWGVVPDPRKEVDLEQWIYGRRVSDTPVLAAPPSPDLPLPPPPPSRIDLSNLHATLSALLSLRPLNSTLLPMPHIHHTLLLKLALNANINPLTAVLGAGSLPNGSLIGSSPSHRLIRMLSTETSAVITAYLANLHGPSGTPVDLLRLYSRDNLISRTLALCNATARNSSSMAVDASAGRLTEIDYINGYLISLGDRLGVPTPHHQMVREMVKFTSEIMGLKADTWTSDTKRVARRQNRLSAMVRDTQLSAVESEATEDMSEQSGRDKEDAHADWVRRFETRRARRREAREKRRKLRGAMDDSGIASRTDTAQLVERREESSTNGAPVDLSPADLANKEALLTQLKGLGESRQVKEGGLKDSPRPRTDLWHEPEEVHREEKVEEPDEEQDEAIKAIEDRIFSGFGRSGRRGF